MASRPKPEALMNKSLTHIAHITHIAASQIYHLEGALETPMQLLNTTSQVCGDPAGIRITCRMGASPVRLQRGTM